MKLAQIKFTSWGKTQYYFPGEPELNKDDHVIVDLNGAEEIGRFLGYCEVEEDNIREEKNKKENGDQEMQQNGKNNGKFTVSQGILRKAEDKDMKMLPTKEEKDKAMRDCQYFIEKHDLQIKLIDVHFSLDRTKMTFAFSSEGRVDFRGLVRELTSHFNCVIRLHQIGKRDEAKIIGDCGPCGQPLCCRRFIRDFSSITSKMAETQQVVHRGSERISGMCARLKCCLEYEQEGYKQLAANLPSIGEKWEVDGKKGVVVNCNVLKQTMDVKVNGDTKEEINIVEVDIETGKPVQNGKQ